MSALRGDAARRGLGGRRGRGIALAAGLAGTLGCARIDVDKVYAVRLEQAPTEAAWDLAAPRLLKAGGGSVHGRLPVLAGLELDTDAVHGASASCHHGPPVTHPVPVQVRSWYTAERLWLEVRWDDSTADRVPRSWRRAAAGAAWEIALDDEDGVAVIWTRSAGRFGCQEACHQSDFAVRSGSLVDVRSMFAAEGAPREEAWVWKPSLGGRELFLERRGFVTPAGEPYRVVNSRSAADSSLGAEARLARTFSREDAPATDAAGSPVAAAALEAPAARWAPPGGSRVDARGERTCTGWRVIFSRPLAPGEGREAFVPGERRRFGLAVFDGTSVNHHVVRDAQTFELVVPSARRDPREDEG
jgi:hypothetical protein